MTHQTFTIVSLSTFYQRSIYGILVLLFVLASVLLFVYLTVTRVLPDNTPKCTGNVCEKQYTAQRYSTVNNSKLNNKHVTK